jgi:hypothetical protein
MFPNLGSLLDSDQSAKSDGAGLSLDVIAKLHLTSKETVPALNFGTAWSFNNVQAPHLFLKVTVVTYCTKLVSLHPDQTNNK